LLLWVMLLPMLRVCRGSGGRPRLLLLLVLWLVQMILLLLVLFVLILLSLLPVLFLLGRLLLLLVSCLLLLLFIAVLPPVLLLLLLPVLSLASNHSWHAVGIPCSISSCCLARLLRCCKTPAIRLLMPAANSCCCCACCRILPLLLLLLVLGVRFGVVLCKLHGWYWGSCCCRVLIQSNGITVGIIKLVAVLISMLQHVRKTAAWQSKGLVVSLLAAAAAAAATQTCFHCTLSSNTNSCIGLLKACQNGCRSALQHTCTYTGTLYFVLCQQQHTLMFSFAFAAACRRGRRATAAAGPPPRLLAAP
jgi:uncharacterized membrane protein